MPKYHVMNKRSKAVQRKLNKEAKAAIRTLNQLKSKHFTKLKPLMFKFDFEVLASALQLVRYELRNQTLTMTQPNKIRSAYLKKYGRRGGAVILKLRGKNAARAGVAARLRQKLRRIVR